jgi:NAD(P)H-dependent FMN reductase
MGMSRPRLQIIIGSTRPGRRGAAEEWRHKPVGFVGYGGIAAGARAILALTPVVVALGMTPLSRAVHIPLINRALAADGSLTTDGRLDGSASTLLDDLFHHAERASIDAAAAV